MATIVRKATPGTVSVGGSSVQALAANPNRKYALLRNSSDTGIWMSFGTAAVIGDGIYLEPAGGYFEIDNDCLWQGTVFVIAATGSGKVLGTMELS